MLCAGFRKRLAFPDASGGFDPASLNRLNLLSFRTKRWIRQIPEGDPGTVKEMNLQKVPVWYSHQEAGTA
jgi:hypothetical protein